MTTKPTTEAHDLSPQLQGLTRRLKAWRSQRQPGQRIPDALWKAGVKASPIFHRIDTAKLYKPGQKNY